MASLARSNLIVHLWSAGRWPELRDLLSSHWAETLDRSALASRCAVARWLQVATGEPPEPLPAVVAELETSPDLQGRAWAHNARAAGMVEPREQSDRASMALDAARAAMEWGGLEDDFVHHWSISAEACLAMGDATRTREVLEVVESRPPGLIPPYVAAQLLRFRGMAALADDPTAGEADLRSAIAALDSFGAPFTRAQADLGLSVHLSRSGREPEGAELMARARATFTSLGAKAWLARTTAPQLSDVPS
jgi:hypothetical protein